MAEFESYDYDDVSTGGPAPLENGVYKAMAVSAEPTETTTGKAAMKIRWSVIEDAAGEKVMPRRTVFDTVVVSQSTKWRMLQCAQAAGISALPNNSPEARQAFCEELLQSDGVFLRTRQEPYEGRVTLRVAAYLTEDEASDAAAA